MTHEEELENDCKNAENMRQDSIKSSDSMLRFLSSGGLALSLTIYDKVYSNQYPWLLVLTWLFYFSSLFSTLFSFYTAQKTFDKQILCNKAQIEKKAYSPKMFLRYQKTTILLNYFSLIAFCFGSITFLAFSSINLLNKDNTMTRVQIQNGLTCSTASQENTVSSGKVLLEGLTPSSASIQLSNRGLTPSTVSTNNTNNSNNSGNSQGSEK